MTSREKILEMFPGSFEMPDPSGSPSADYCIMRPATKEDWPENRWVMVGPYVSGNPWDAAWEKWNPDEDFDVWLSESGYLQTGCQSSMRAAWRAAMATKEKRT